VCLVSKTLGLLLHREIVLYKLHAGDLPGNPRRLGTGHEILNLAAQRDHSRIGLSMNTGFLQIGVFRDLLIDSCRNRSILVIDRRA
jgi:hypothetical protein